MSALSIQVPFPVFQDRDGQPLENGYVWIGQPNLAPQVNPVNVYFDAALTQPAAQPLRTINGYISNAGTPAQVYVDGVNFSILVQDSKGSMVYNFPDGTGISPDACGVTYDPPFTGGVPYPVCEKLAQTVSVKDFGAVGDGVADDTAAIQAAIDAVIAAPASLSFPDGTYVITAPLVISEVSGVELKASYRGATIKKTGNAVDGHYGVDALLVIQNTSPGYGYSHHIDGLNFDGLTSGNAYGIYAPRISQCVFENGSITGAVIGIYSFDAWLCSVRNMNISCGDPQSPSVITAGSVGILMDRGTSLFLQNVWCRICETGYKFTTSMAYSSMNSCACDGFSGVAYDFTGSSFSINGGGAEATVGASAIVYKLNNSRVTLNGASSFDLGPSAFFDLFLSEMSINNSSFGQSTNPGAGFTFRSRGGSLLTWHGRVFPTNTATVYDVDSTSKLVRYTAADGVVMYYNDGVLKTTTVAGPSGDIAAGRNVFAGQFGYLGVTSGGGAQQKFAEKSSVDNTVRIYNVNQASILFNVDGVDRAQVKTTGAFNFTPRAMPVSPTAGDVYYDSGTNKLRCYNGTSWNDLF